MGKTRRKRSSIIFPVGGVNRKRSYKQTPPYTSPDALNVRPIGGIEGRQRGGSRPGLVKSHSPDLVGAIRLISQVTVADVTSFTRYSDNFTGQTIEAVWAQATWASGVPSILNQYAQIDTSGGLVAVTRDTLPIDSSSAYDVEMYIVPWLDSLHGDYYLYLRLDDAAPDITDAGVEVKLTMSDATGDFTYVITSLTGGTPTVVATETGTLAAAAAIPFWFRINISGDTIKVYLDGTLESTDTIPTSHTDLGIGYGLECQNASGICLANTFRVQFSSTNYVKSLRSYIVTSAGGDLYREGNYGTIQIVSSNLSLRSDDTVRAVQSGQKLYIADHGETASGTDGVISGSTIDSATYPDWTTETINKYDYVVELFDASGPTEATYEISSIAVGAITLTSAPGDGTCSFRIFRMPKVYDPATDTMTALIATAGSVPSDCPLIAHFVDRIVFAGAANDPQIWYMSRQGSETDYDYSQTDAQRAVAGTTEEKGKPSFPITSLASHSDDYLLIGCRDSIWRLAGDPAFGGALNNLSRSVGILSGDAWCHGPNGEFVFLSLDGIYGIAAGGNSYPEPISRELLPDDFRNIDPDQTLASLEFDQVGRGVHIFLTGRSYNSRLHWWMDWDNKTFWPVSYGANYEPTCTGVYRSEVIEDYGVILGGRDGTLRRHSDAVGRDDGAAFTSYVLMGPLSLSSDGNNGRIIHIDGTLAGDSSNVTWAIQASQTYEGSVTASVASTGTWSSGANTTIHAAGVGQAYCLRLTGASGGVWAFEDVLVESRDAGRRRTL